MTAPAFAVAPEERVAALRIRAARVKAARSDGAAFNEYVLRDEETASPIVLAPTHEDWHRLIDRNDRLIIWSHVEGGKTSQISIGRTIYELGRDPSKRVLVISNTAGQAVKITRTVAHYIENSRECREVFPHLKPAKPWSSNEITVERPTYSKDPSVRATGVFGNIVGGRVDILILDDILDLENTRFPQHRDALREWFLSACVGRLTKNARVIVVGNAYHPDDLLHWLANDKGYIWRRYKVANDNGEPTWPQAWSKERIAKKRAELGPVEAARQLDCVARDDSTARCQQAWILACLKRGVSVPLLSGLTRETTPPGATVVTGVDIGVKKTRKAGKTALATIMFLPNGDRQILEVISGRFSGLEILQQIISAQRRFGSVVYVEDNGAQDFIIQFARLFAEALRNAGEDPLALEDEIAAHIRSITTGGNKMHPVFGVESIFVEFGSAKWIIPAANEAGTVGASPPIVELLAEALNYNPQAHTGDHLMALWLAREGGRKHIGDPREATARVLGDDDETADETPERAEMLEGWEYLLKRRPA